MKKNFAEDIKYLMRKVDSTMSMATDNVRYASSSTGYVRELGLASVPTLKEIARDADTLVGEIDVALRVSGLTNGERNALLSQKASALRAKSLVLGQVSRLTTISNTASVGYSFTAARKAALDKARKKPRN